jgi:hypothetical protein
MKLASLTTHKREGDDQENQEKRGTPKMEKQKHKPNQEWGRRE